MIIISTERAADAKSIRRHALLVGRFSARRLVESRSVIRSQCDWPCQLVTTDEVLCEFLSAVARGGPVVRRTAVEAVRRMLVSPDIVVIEQSRQTLWEALSRYGQRLDKEYSLVDCASMNAMDNEDIRDVLTNDHHFTQEGYNAMIRNH